MKKLFTTLAFTIAVSIAVYTMALAQAPQSFSYQAVARNINGIAIANQKVSFRISLVRGTINGLSVYSETHSDTTDQYGIINLAIGGGTKVSGDFSTINWANGSYFVKVEMDAMGGNSYALMGTSQLLSVPYALYADNINLKKNNIPQNYYITDNGFLMALPKINVEYPYNALPTVTDASNNTYNIVKIGTQVWMAENLKTTKYNDNTIIPLVIDKTVWATLITPAYCSYNNTLNIDTINTYGRLYNWYTVNTNKLCPSGWHVPSDAEWTILSTYLGSMAGGRMKEAGTTHWSSPNTDATNESNFSALPGGRRSEIGSFSVFVNGGYWWSATDGNPPTGAFYRHLSFDNSDMQRNYINKTSGFSIRCLKDN